MQRNIIKVRTDINQNAGKADLCQFLLWNSTPMSTEGSHGIKY